MKPKYPIAIIYARDWGISGVDSAYTLEEAEKIKVPQGWLVGWLIEDNKGVIKIAHEYFDVPGEEEFRYISTIPKETILYKKIIAQGDM